MTSRFQPPPIIKAAERLLVDVEQAVRGFPRYHRYQIGGDLRTKAMAVYRVANRAWRERAYQSRHVSELVWTIDEAKQHLQVSKLLGATRSFRQFEHLARQLDDIGQQAGGWLRHLHPKAQNAPGARAVVQCGQKLSTQATSMMEVNS